MDTVSIRINFIIIRGANERPALSSILTVFLSHIILYYFISLRLIESNGFSLHVACGVGASTKVIHAILKCYPEAVLMRTAKGSTPKQCLNLTNAANKEEARKLIRKYFAEVESRYRPIKPISSELVLV